MGDNSCYWLNLKIGTKTLEFTYMDIIRLMVYPQLLTWLVLFSVAIEVSCAILWSNVLIAVDLRSRMKDAVQAVILNEERPNVSPLPNHAPLSENALKNEPLKKESIVMNLKNGWRPRYVRGMERIALDWSYASTTDAGKKITYSGINDGGKHFAMRSTPG